MVESSAADDPHHGQPLLHLGAAPADAKLAFVLLHGRGAGAEDILGLAQYFFRPDIAYFAPEASGRVWYPVSFLAPTARNEPFLSSALRLVDATVSSLVEAGFARERIVLAGFSQGACLATEYVARRGQPLAGLAALSGGLIGETPTLSLYRSGLAGMPAFFGCSDDDLHIPQARVEESAEIMRGLGAEVTKRIYPAMGHTVNEEEVGWVDQLIDRLLAG